MSVFWFLQTMGTANGIWRETFTHPVRSLTRYARNMTGPTFILVTHFTSKIKLIKFLNERGKISPLRYGHITTDAKESFWMI